MFSKTSVELIDHMGDDKRACLAARVSLLNDEDQSELNSKDIRLLSFLMREKHTSPFEHSVISFRINAPLPVVAQIMRHRTSLIIRRAVDTRTRIFSSLIWVSGGGRVRRTFNVLMVF